MPGAGLGPKSSVGMGSLWGEIQLRGAVGLQEAKPSEDDLGSPQKQKRRVRSSERP